jgi:TatD DNase family protein
MRLGSVRQIPVFAFLSHKTHLSTLTPFATLSKLTPTSNSHRSISSQRRDKSTSEMAEEKRFKFPMIDVDCNLTHEDLSSMLAGSDDILYKDIERNFRILFHPSTTSSNIHGVFSPASTIEQAEKFHSELIESTFHSRNNIAVKTSVGVHPYHVEEEGSLQDVCESVSLRIKNLIEEDKRNGGYICCIGETGLDYSDGFPDREKQWPWFRYQLELAKEYNLPLFIHERLAFNDTVSLIDQTFPDPMRCPPIIIHCFTGTVQECLNYIKRGYYISVSGYILKNGEGPEEVKKCLRDGIIPIERLMIETDAPYMGFNGCRDVYFEKEGDDFQNLSSKKKKRLLKGIYPNVPSALPMVLKTAVELINEGKRTRNEEEISVDAAASQFLKTSMNFFKMD